MSGAADAEVIELSSDEDEKPEAPSPRSRKRARRAAPPAAAAPSGAQQQFDLTADSDEEDEESAHMDRGHTNAGAGSSSDGGDGYITIDLCEDEDEEGGGAAFAKQLNMLFDGDVQIVEERKRDRDGRRQQAKREFGDGSSNAIDLGSDDDDEYEHAAANGDDEDDEDADARLAARMQAAIDADARKEAERLAGANDQDAALAARLQARLARDIAASEDSDGPRDVLKAQRKQIQQWLQQNGKTLKVRDVWANPNAQPGGALYQRFAAAYDSASDHGVRLVFHGTREENIEAICQHGLDPKYRGKNGQALGQGEYFADNPSISIPYCAGGGRMLVFAVLMDRSGLTKHQQGIVVINRPEHQLPMFVLTFENPIAAAHANLPNFAGGAFSSAAIARLTQMGMPAAQLQSLLARVGGRAPPPPPPPRPRAPPPPRAPRGKGKARARR